MATRRGEDRRASASGCSQSRANDTDISGEVNAGRGPVERLDADSWADSTLVFTTRVETPVHPRNDYRSFRELIQQTNLRQVRIHDLRHTAASVLLAQGVPARVVMEILGHSQISVILNTYAHVAPEVSREAADRVDDALWGDG